MSDDDSPRESDPVEESEPVASGSSDGSGPGAPDGSGPGSRLFDFDDNDRPRWLNDLKIIAVATALVYLLFIVLGALAGLGFNGIMSTLQQVTFFSVAFALIVLGLNLHWGYTGLFNIGVAGFMAVGVYTTAMLSAAPDASVPGLGLSLWIAIPAGVVAAAIVGFVVALPALRLRADYFAIVTLGFAEVIRRFYNSATLRSFEVRGVELGSGGGAGISFPNIRHTVSRHLLYVDGERGEGTSIAGDLIFALADPLGIARSVVESSIYTVIMVGLVIGVFVLLTRIGNSPFGRILKAIREDELVAKSLGKDTNRAKITVFMLGCAVMGLGGIFWQGSRGYADPSLFMPIITFYIFVALIIGGAGSNTGSIIGSIVFAGLLFEGPPFIQRIIQRNVDWDRPTTLYEGVVELGVLNVEPILGYTVANLPNVRFIIVGVVLIALMIYRPDGLLGHRNEPAAAVDIRGSRTKAKPRASATEANGGQTDE